MIIFVHSWQHRPHADAEVGRRTYRPSDHPTWSVTGDLLRHGRSRGTYGIARLGRTYPVW